MSDNYTDNKEANIRRPLPRANRKPYEEYTPADVAARLNEARKDLTNPKNPLAKLLSDPNELEQHLQKVERLLVSSIEKAFIKVGKKFDRKKFVGEVQTSQDISKSVVDNTLTSEQEIVPEKKERPYTRVGKPAFILDKISKPEGIEKVVVVDRKGELSGVKLGDLAIAQDSASKKEPDDTRSKSLLGRVGKDIFKTAFPTINKVIEYVENERKQKSTEGVREATRSRRSLDKTESMSSALQLLTSEQRKSVDLLGDLLEATKGLGGRSGGGLGGLIGGMGGKAGRLLRGAAPVLAGAAVVGAVGLGAYALSNVGDDEENEGGGAATSTQPTTSETSAIPETPTTLATPIVYSNNNNDLVTRTSTSGMLKDSNITAAADYKSPIIDSTEPLVKNDTPTSGSISDMTGMDLILKARSVTFKGDEIEFVGAVTSQVAKPGITSIPGLAPSGAAGGAAAPAVSGGGGSASSEGSGSQQFTTEQEGAADTGSLTFASGVDPRIKKDIAQKVQQIESAFGKKLTVTSGFRDPHRNAAAGGARNSAHTRANAVDIRFQGNEEETNKLIEVASAAGIGGIGVYRPGWVHLDTESKRVWGPDFSARTVPEWAKDTLQAHMTGQIQKSPAGETAAAEPVTASPASPSMAETPSSSGGGEGGGQMETSGSAAAVPAPEPPGNEMGAAVAGASQENAMAERTPVPPTVTAVQSGSQAQATPGTAVPDTSNQNPNDPGNVEPDDAAERYAKLFNMAA